MKIKTTLIALGTVAALSAPALAQDSTNQQSQASTSDNTALQQAQAEEFFRASKLIGKNTQTGNGQKLGELKEIVFNQQGEIFALLDIGSGKWAAVPWQVVQPGSAKGGQNLVLNTTQQALKSAPAVTKDQWGSLNNPKFAQGVYAYFHVQPANSAMGGSSDQGGVMQGQGSSSGSSSSSASDTNSQIAPTPQRQDQQQQPQPQSQQP